jgi:TfoX/Sxy family transcriptional regulator of competence genes
MSSVVYNEAFAGRVRAALAGQPNVDEKKMFGGLTFMVSGQMCCGVLKDDLIVKIDPDWFDQAMQQPGVRPFDFTGKPMTGMVYVASGEIGSAAALQAWVQRGVEYVKAHPKVAQPAARRRKS